MSRLLIVVTTVLLLSTSSFAQGLTYDEQVHDFGHVGIDFRFFHTYQYINKTENDVKIIDIDVSCDCSEVNFADSVVHPGDTAAFHLIFSTKDYYGPTNKSITVKTTDPTMPEFSYFYTSIVGQWYDALKPSPISLFLLPGVKSKKVSVKNVFFDKLKLGDVSQYDNKFSYEIISKEASKGSQIEIELTPADDIKPGTHFSVLTFDLITENKEKPVVISVPIKIVRY